MAVFTFAAVNATAAGTTTFTTASTDAVTGTAPSTESTTSFIFAPYVILAVMIVTMFGASFARYHFLHSNNRATRTHAARLHGSRVANQERVGTPMASDGAMPSTSRSHLSKHAKSIDVKKVLASIYQEGHKRLLGPDGKMRIQRVGRTTCGSRGKVQISGDEVQHTPT